ncbi:MAG: Ig-like domain-containing protein, partial [Gemmatimonadota bacterium]
PPFDADTGVALMYKHCHDTPEPVTVGRPDCPLALAQAVDRMLSKDPADRWPTMEEALSGIGGLALAFDDPVRTKMIDLALAGENREILRRISTPRSPMPISRVVPAGERRDVLSTDAETVKLASHQRSSISAMPVPRSHKGRWVIAGGALVLAVAAALVTIPRLNREEPTPAQSVPQQLTAIVARIAIAPLQAELDVGDTIQLAASSVDGDGNAADAADLVWTTSDPSVAEVTAVGLVTAVAPGHAVISAASAGLIANSQIAVLAPEQPPTPPVSAPTASRTAAVASVAMQAPSAMMNVGETQQLRAVPRDQRGSTLSGRRVTWSSSNTAVATVSTSGIVSATSPGTATIAASSGGQSARVVITVMAEAVARVTIEPSSPGKLQVGETVRLGAAGWSSRNQELAGRGTTWTSDDDGVATVSETGMVTAVGPGRTEITAEIAGRSARITIEVAAPAAAEPAVVIDPRAEISGVIQQYARALESKDMARVRSVFPSIGAEQASQLEDSFESMRDLRVVLAVDRLDVHADEARAEVSGTYHFYNADSRRDENAAVSFQIVLQRSPNGWVITATR